jgi:hypothetical protein
MRRNWGLATPTDGQRPNTDNWLSESALGLTLPGVPMAALFRNAAIETIQHLDNLN